MRHVMNHGHPHGSSVAPMLIRLVLALGLLWHGVGDLLVRIDPTPASRPAALALGLLPEAPVHAAPDTMASGQILATNTSALPTIEQAILPEGGADAEAAPINSTPASTPDGMTRLHQRTLAVHRAAQPSHAPSLSLSDNSNDGGAPVSVLPTALGSGNSPAIIAWLSIVLQLIASAGLLVGLLTRFAAGVVLVGMVAHLWVASVGPAAMLGTPLLPAGGLFTADAAAIVLLPLGAIALAVALLAAGSGAAGIDSIMAGDSDEYDPDE
jgi:uncharacterized membrane protein YphA (DoxX/SURF4 family)